MKTKKTSNEKKEFEKANPFSHCGDFQKMAEMMKNCCPNEDGALDCCSFASRMMGQGKKAQETKEKT